MEMTPEPSTQVGRGSDYQGTPRVSNGRRRDKPQLSCDLCRRRKLRCDRLQPCSTCSSRGQTCTYPEDSRPSSGAASIHQRLVQLERLVMSSASKPISPLNVGVQVRPTMALPFASSPLHGHHLHGIMHNSDSRLQYVGGDHWTAILDSIADLKDHCHNQEQVRTPANLGHVDHGAEGSTGQRSLLLYGGYAQISRAEILSALPSKVTVDRYVSRYFTCSDLVSAAIHGPTFLQQYDEFWADPSTLPIAWVGLLFGIMCLAVCASEHAEPANDNEVEQQSAQISLYREKIAQCLMLSEYTQAGPYVLQAMIHYVYIEFALKADADKDIWFLFALEVNMAKRMGCHRDPTHFPGITSLESEMRRRLWTIVIQGDVLISSQMGMPRMISDWQWDTLEPRNLNDTDLSESTTELPNSRPETEITTVLGTIARRRLLVALGTISDIAASVKPCDHADLLRAEASLHEAAASIPPPFKMKPRTASLADSAQIFMSQLFISHLFYKGQIMLHRRFVMAPTAANDAATFSYSCKACVDACLSMLNIQHVLDEETRRGARLDMMRWRVSSILNHQFLTATMILCSLLHRFHTLEREEEILRVLRSAKAIWLRNTISEAAGKAADAINFVLNTRMGGNPEDNVQTDVGAMAVLWDDLTEQDNGSGNSSSLQSRAMSQDQTELYHSAPFRYAQYSDNMTFTPADPQDSHSFDFNTLESGIVPNEWTMLNSTGTIW